MTTQAAVSRIHRWTGLLASWVGYLGAMAAFVLLGALLFMPLGHMIFDYWTPKVQGLWQPAAPAVRVMRGK